MAEDDRKRRILVIIGSDSDLGQCQAGLMALKDAQTAGLIEMPEEAVLTMSVHRNTLELFRELEDRHRLNDVDAIITGAGWANHLSGMDDAYLRYTLWDDRIVVLGVGFEDERNERHTRAAELSMTEVPGTQLVTSNIRGGPFIGASGFLLACKYAIYGDLPKITIPKPRPTKRRTLDEAIAGVEPDPARAERSDQS